MTESNCGRCPICGEPVLSRERRPNGNDTCRSSHTFPSKDAITCSVFTKDNTGSGFSEYKKKVTTMARRIKGAFAVVTREGFLKCPDGYLAIDSGGWPSPIAKDEFEHVYELVGVITNPLEAIAAEMAERMLMRVCDGCVDDIPVLAKYDAWKESNR